MTTMTTVIVSRSELNSVRLKEQLSLGGVGGGAESSGVTNFFSSRAVQGLPASLPATFFATNCQLVVGNIYGQQDSRAEYNSSTPLALILTTRNIIQLIFAHLS